jgi:hypothetical protein
MPREVDLALGTVLELHPQAMISDDFHRGRVHQLVHGLYARGVAQWMPAASG